MSNEIENLLGRMPLRKPPASLDDRVIGRRRRRRILAWSVASGAVAAAAAAVVVAVLLTGNDGNMVARSPNPPAVSNAPAERVAQAPSPKPLRLERNWAAVSYEGVVAPDEGAPLMKFRRRTLGHVQMIDQARGRQMEMTVPGEEVILIKAPVD